MKSVTLIEFDFRMMSEAVIHLTLDMHNSSHHTKLHSITAKYFNLFFNVSLYVTSQAVVVHTSTTEF